MYVVGSSVWIVCVVWLCGASVWIVCVIMCVVYGIAFIHSDESEEYHMGRFTRYSMIELTVWLSSFIYVHYLVPSWPTILCSVVLYRFGPWLINWLIVLCVMCYVGLRASTLTRVRNTKWGRFARYSMIDWLIDSGSYYSTANRRIPYGIVVGTMLRDLSTCPGILPDSTEGRGYQMGWFPGTIIVKCFLLRICKTFTWSVEMFCNDFTEAHLLNTHIFLMDSYYGLYYDLPMVLSYCIKSCLVWKWVFYKQKQIYCVQKDFIGLLDKTCS
jgi:hypothetical protein